MSAFGESGSVTRYTVVTLKDQVTDEVYEIVADVRDGWPDETWDDTFDRAEGVLLNNGTELDWGPVMDTPAMRAIKARYRKESQ